MKKRFPTICTIICLVVSVGYAKDVESKSGEKRDSQSVGALQGEHSPKTASSAVKGEPESIDLFGPPKKNSREDSLIFMYVDEIKYRIIQYLPKVHISVSKPADIEFGVNRDGTLQFVKILHSSGNRAFDFQSQRAVQLAFPMPPIPKEITEIPLIRTFRNDSRNYR